MSFIPIPTYNNPYPDEMPMGDVNQYLNSMGIGGLIDQLVIMCIGLVIIMVIVPFLPYLLKKFIFKPKVLRFKHRDCDGKGCEGCQGYGYIELKEESWGKLS
jgi:hypothetical protein